MPRLRRPKYTFWTLDGKRCKSTTPGATRHKGQSPNWHGTYQTADGKEVEVKLSREKDTARRMLAELQRAADLERAGLGDPYAQHRRRPLADHLEDYLSRLALSVEPLRVRYVRQRVECVLGEAGCTLIEHLQPSTIEAAAGRIRAKRRLAPGTVNAYLGDCKTFSRWLATDRRCAADPLLGLERLPVVEPRRRRALAPGELAKLVAAAGEGPPKRGLTGPARAVLYQLAANTGLRAHELASLTPASFDWERLTVTVAAKVSKHRQEDVLPLRSDVAQLVRRYCAGLGANAKLFPGPWYKKAADVIRGDLAAAGVPVEVGGRVADFHALRYTFGTSLAAAGVHPKVAMELMRHSSINLTLNLYTDARLLDIRGALDQLPGLPGVAPPKKDSA